MNSKIFFALIIMMVALGALFFLFGKDKKSSQPSAIKEAVEQIVSQVKNKGLSDEELKKEIGQMLMIGFRGAEIKENSEIYNVLKDVKPGGVVLFDYDKPSNSYARNITNPGQTKSLISELQKYSQIPLLVAVDAEGGNVNRLKPKYGFASIVSAQKMGEDKTFKAVEQESKKLADELADLGFNMNLAPVVDLNINSLNPVIGAIGRSFSKDSETVVKNAEIFIKNHLDKNIVTVAKHFPGQGSATQDSHLGMVDVTGFYKEEELAPYQQLNSQGLLDAVMTAHVINKKIDENFPASMSENFLEYILRNQIGFEGVIISDDMQMDAIAKNYDFDKALIQTINAGTDIVSILNNTSNGYDSQMPYKARDVIFNAVKEGKIKEEKITQSYNRIIKLKKKFIFDALKNRPFELLSSDPVTFGQAVEAAEYVSQKTAIRPAFLLAVFQQELLLEKTDMCYLTDFKTGSGTRIADGNALQKVMNPQRDIAGFLDITKELKKDPSKTPVTCPMEFGWGGAIGPADFIASTWLKYKEEVEGITGKPADPWDFKDSLLAAGIYLSKSGAWSKEPKGEWNAAMEYFSGSIFSPHKWYADGVLDISQIIQAEIDILEKEFSI